MYFQTKDARKIPQTSSSHGWALSSPITILSPLSFWPSMSLCPYALSAMHLPPLYVKSHDRLTRPQILPISDCKPSPALQMLQTKHGAISELATWRPPDWPPWGLYLRMTCHCPVQSGPPRIDSYRVVSSSRPGIQLSQMTWTLTDLTIALPLGTWQLVAFPVPRSTCCCSQTFVFAKEKSPKRPRLRDLWLAKVQPWARPTRGLETKTLNDQSGQSKSCHKERTPPKAWDRQRYPVQPVWHPTSLMLGISSMPLLPTRKCTVLICLLENSRIPSPVVLSFLRCLGLGRTW